MAAALDIETAAENVLHGRRRRVGPGRDIGHRDAARDKPDPGRKQRRNAFQRSPAYHAIRDRVVIHRLPKGESLRTVSRPPAFARLVFINRHDDLSFLLVRRMLAAARAVFLQLNAIRIILLILRCPIDRHARRLTTGASQCHDLTHDVVLSRLELRPGRPQIRHHARQPLLIDDSHAAGRNR